MFKFCWHCWHHIDGTRRKLKAKNKCKESNSYISGGGLKAPHVKYIMKKRCCKCGEIRNTDVYEDHDIQRGLSYPNYEEIRDKILF